MFCPVLAYQPAALHLFEMEGMLRGRARWELASESAGTLLVEAA